MVVCLLNNLGCCQLAAFQKPREANDPIQDERHSPSADEAENGSSFQIRISLREEKNGLLHRIVPVRKAIYCSDNSWHILEILQYYGTGHTGREAPTVQPLGQSVRRHITRRIKRTV